MPGHGAGQLPTHSGALWELTCLTVEVCSTPSTYQSILRSPWCVFQSQRKTWNFPSNGSTVFDGQLM